MQHYFRAGTWKDEQLTHNAKYICEKTIPPTLVWFVQICPLELWWNNKENICLELYGLTIVSMPNVTCMVGISGVNITFKST